MKRFFRIISAVLLISVTLGSVSSCKSIKETVQKIFEKDREYNEAEVISAAKELLSKAQRLNEIYYGHGIEYDASDISNANGYYYPADIMSLDKFGVTSLDDIKALTRECFTTGQSDYMINTVLSSIRDGSGDIIFFARYYQEYETLSENVKKCLMVYSKYEPLLVDTIEYFYDTVKVVDVEGEIIKVEIEVKATSPSGDVQMKKVVVNLLEEENGFRLDSPTYVRNTQNQE